MMTITFFILVAFFYASIYVGRKAMDLVDEVMEINAELRDALKRGRK